MCDRQEDRILRINILGNLNRYITILGLVVTLAYPPVRTDQLAYTIRQFEVSTICAV
jgi:hypothetical protein